MRFRHPLLQIWFPKNNYIWIKIKIIKETKKAILVDACCSKFWIAKSQIKKIRLKNRTFEIRVWEKIIG